jgi:hypothetical protein
VIVALTLTPASGPGSLLAPTCILCGDHGLADAGANILLFVPLGAALAAAGVRARHVLLAALALSAGIEFLQQLLPSRAPTFRDVGLNAAGAWLAAMMVIQRREWISPPPGRARWMGLIASPLPAFVVLTTGWLLTPAPSHDSWFSLWTPRLRNFASWDGEIRSAAIGSLPLPRGRLRDARLVRDSVRARRPLHLAIIVGTPPSGLAAIYGIYDRARREVLLVGVDGTDLVFSEYRRATSLRLDQPVVRFPRFFEGATRGEPMSIDIEPAARGACVSRGTERWCDEPFSAGSAWSFVAWQDGWTSPWIAQVLNALTLLVLVAPAAYWGARARRIGPIAITIALLVGSSLGPARVRWVPADLIGAAAGLVLATLGGTLSLLRSPTITAIMRPRDDGTLIDAARRDA